LATVAANVTSYTDSGVIAGNTYCYRVDAFNGTGSSAFTNEVCGTLGSATTPTFDFSLASGGNKSPTQGQSVSNSIAAPLSSGSPQAVSFSTSGLPGGATASFSSASCNLTCSSTLTINTSGSTPAGTSTITVTGTSGGITKTTSFALTVTSPASTAIISPAQGTTLTPGQTVTATGSGTNLSWDIDLWVDGLPSFKTGTGSSITFTVPTTANSSQFVRINLTGDNGSVTRDYGI